jgi:hypothetical protein
MILTGSRGQTLIVALGHEAIHSTDLFVIVIDPHASATFGRSVKSPANDFASCSSVPLLGSPPRQECGQRVRGLEMDFDCQDGIGENRSLAVPRPQWRAPSPDRHWGEVPK